MVFVRHRHYGHATRASAHPAQKICTRAQNAMQMYVMYVQHVMAVQLAGEPQM